MTGIGAVSRHKSKSSLASLLTTVQSYVTTFLHRISGERRNSVAWGLVSGPLAMAFLAAAHAATVASGLLSTGSDGTDDLLVALSLVVVVGSAMAGRWQYRAIVRPLRQLARSAGAEACSAVIRGGAVASEIALLGKRLEPDPAVPERDR